MWWVNIDGGKDGDNDDDDDGDDGDGDDDDLAITMNTSVFDLSEEKPRRRVKEGKDLGKYV